MPVLAGCLAGRPGTKKIMSWKVQTECPRTALYGNVVLVQIGSSCSVLDCLSL